MNASSDPKRCQMAKLPAIGPARRKAIYILRYWMSHTVNLPGNKCKKMIHWFLFNLCSYEVMAVIWKKNEKNKYAIRKYKWECWKMSMLIKWEQKSVQESHLQFYNVLTFIFGFSWLQELNKSLMDVICPSFIEASNSFRNDDLLIFLDFPVRLHIKVSSDRIFLKIWGCTDTEVFNNRNIQIDTEKIVSKSKLI